MNALAIRNMCKHFAIRGVIPKHDSIGICTPYAAQTKILKSVIQGIADIECGTVHSYQGREKERMVLDIPDSLGEMGVGFFLHAGKEHDENDGAHLFNVAISRAREQLIVFANLSFLDKKLPEQAFLRDVLANMQTRGKVIDVREVLDLYPIIEDLRTYGHPLDLSAEAYSSGLFNQHDFEVVCGADMEQAKRGIAIFSGFVTPQRVRQYESLFRMKSAQGVAIRCVTRPPQKNGNIPPDQCTDALDGLEQMGCVVDTRGNIHEKVVIIDGKIVWFGSLNPLSHTSNTSEAMARHEGEKAAQQLATFMSLSARGGSDPSAGDVFCGENPRCPSCGSRTAHMIGQHGPYWLCEKGDWKKNVIQHKAAERLSGVVAEDAPQCECGMPMVIRSGPWGPFFGCSTFPKCSHMKPIKGRSPKPAKAPTRPSKPS
jgi:hemerythrin superfamily protein